MRIVQMPTLAFIPAVASAGCSGPGGEEVESAPASGRYKGEARLQIARRFGGLPSYSDEKVEEPLRDPSR